MAFSDKLKKLRKQKHMTQQSLANALGISASAVGMYEQGRRDPDFETLEAIADFFNVNMGYLLDSSDNSTSKKTPVQKGELGPDVNSAKLALFGGDGEVTDEMWEEALFAAQIIKERYRRKKENDE